MKLQNPYPLFMDGSGALLDGGYIYVGQPNQNPETPLYRYNLFFDAALTVPAPQPLRTLGGFIVNGQNPAFVYLAQTDFSMTVKDVDGVLVSYTPTWAESAPSYQPLDADLTNIAAVATTAYGRNLLALANQAALKSATGIVDCIPLTGGSPTGNITRSGGGVYPYYSASGFTGGRIYLTVVGAADPTSQPGDIWFAY